MRAKNGHRETEERQAGGTGNQADRDSNEADRRNSQRHIEGVPIRSEVRDTIRFYIAIFSAEIHVYTICLHVYLQTET